jgi:hypothetical protein
MKRKLRFTSQKYVGWLHENKPFGVNATFWGVNAECFGVSAAILGVNAQKRAAGRRY